MLRYGQEVYISYFARFGLFEMNLRFGVLFVNVESVRSGRQDEQEAVLDRYFGNSIVNRNAYRTARAIDVQRAAHAFRQSRDIWKGAWWQRRADRDLFKLIGRRDVSAARPQRKGDHDQDDPAERRAQPKGAERAPIRHDPCHSRFNLSRCVHGANLGIVSEARSSLGIELLYEFVSRLVGRTGQIDHLNADEVADDRRLAQI